MKPELDTRADEVDDDPLAAALLPSILHQLGNATQHLTTLNALLSSGPGGVPGQAGDLAHVSDQVRELGWMLGVLASAQGADLLLERRERDGLRILVGFVRQGLGRIDHNLQWNGERAVLSPDVADGWQLPWAIGSFVWHGALARKDLASFRLVHTDSWRVITTSHPDTPAWHAFLQRLAHELPDCAVERNQERTSLVLPAGWLKSS